MVESATANVSTPVLPTAPDPFIYLAPDDPRRMMADRQLRTFEVFDIGVLSAFESVPRDRFVAKGSEAVAYSDLPLPCASGRRMLLSPMILGRLIQEARLLPGQSALDVAGGSGYSACILGRIAGSVVALEAEALESAIPLGANVERVVGAVTEPPAGKGPFDVILVNGVIETAPTALLTALADGGRLMTLEPNGAAVHGVRYDRVGADWTRRIVFNGSGPRLPEFAAPKRFVF